jgi:hypothetical protein
MRSYELKTPCTRLFAQSLIALRDLASDSFKIGNLIGPQNSPIPQVLHNIEAALVHVARCAPVLRRQVLRCPLVCGKNGVRLSDVAVGQSSNTTLFYVDRIINRCLKKVSCLTALLAGQFNVAKSRVRRTELPARPNNGEGHRQVSRVGGGAFLIHLERAAVMWERLRMITSLRQQVAHS